TWRPMRPKPFIPTRVMSCLLSSIVIEPVFMGYEQVIIGLKGLVVAGVFKRQRAQARHGLQELDLMCIEFPHLVRIDTEYTDDRLCTDQGGHYHRLDAFGLGAGTVLEVGVGLGVLDVDALALQD